MGRLCSFGGALECRSVLFWFVSLGEGGSVSSHDEPHHALLTLIGNLILSQSLLRWQLFITLRTCPEVQVSHLSVRPRAAEITWRETNETRAENFQAM